MKNLDLTGSVISMATDFWSPIKLSLGIAAVAAVLVFIFGLLFAKVMSNKRFKGKSIIETALILPLVLPPTVVGFLLIIVFGRNGIGGQLVEWIFNQPIMFTWWAAVIASAVVAFPLMYQSAKAGFEAVDCERMNEWVALVHRLKV